jgi:hypothetical protein
MFILMKNTNQQKKIEPLFGGSFLFQKILKSKRKPPQPVKHSILFFLYSPIFQILL